MTKRKGKAKRPEIRHPDLHRVSTPDHVGLVRAIEDRFLELCNLHRRIRGVDLKIPDSLMSDALRWRMVRARHRRSDFRHSEAEWRSVCDFAQWTLDLNCELRFQPKTTFSRIPA